MKTVKIEKKKIYDHIIGEEYTEVYHESDYELDFAKEHIIEILNEYDDHADDDMKDVLNLEEGFYSFNCGDFDYHITIETKPENLALERLHQNYADIADYIRELGLKEVYAISVGAYEVSVQTTYDDLLRAKDNTSLDLHFEDESDDKFKRLYATIDNIRFVGYEGLDDD